MKAETVIGPVSIVEKPARNYVGIRLTSPFPGLFAQVARDTGVKFEPIDPLLRESYVCRYEAYLADCRQETRKLLWNTELSIKIL